MMRMLKGTAIVLAVLFAAIQLIRPDRTNPPTDASRTIDAILEVTPPAAPVLSRACRDCHSHDTRWPWYSEVAPVSWFLVEHVNHARSHLNLSDWTKYSHEEAAHRLRTMCRYSREGVMPLASYLLIHRDAVLSSEDISAICDWTDAAREILASRSETSTEESRSPRTER